MNDDQNTAILKRLAAIDQTMIVHRQGVVTDVDPLSVALGGSAIAYTSVAALTAGLIVGDVVSALSFGQDLLILGRIGGDRLHTRPQTFTIDSGSVAAGAEATVGNAHGLGLSSDYVIAGHLEDGSFAAQFAWRLDTAASTSDLTAVRFNNHGPNTGEAILKFVIIEVV